MCSEIGIIGLLIFLAMPFTVIFKALKGIKKKITQGVEGLIFLGALCGYIGFLVQSATDNNLFSLVLTTLFWVMTAYIISLNKALTTD
jgi:O-antigen ligase